MPTTLQRKPTSGLGCPGTSHHSCHTNDTPTRSSCHPCVSTCHRLQEWPPTVERGDICRSNFHRVAPLLRPVPRRPRHASTRACSHAWATLRQYICPLPSVPPNKEQWGVAGGNPLVPKGIPIQNPPKEQQRAAEPSMHALEATDLPGTCRAPSYQLQLPGPLLFQGKNGCIRRSPGPS